MLHYYVKRFFSPAILSLKVENNLLYVFYVYDGSSCQNRIKVVKGK